VIFRSIMDPSLLGNRGGPRDNSTMNYDPAKDHSPLVAITLGDPAGIGPEIIARGWSQFADDATFRYAVFGGADYLRRAVAWCGLDSAVIEVDGPDQVIGADASSIVCVRNAAAVFPLALPGQLSGEAGKAAVDSINAAIDATLGGAAAAIVTAPINKEAIHAAGCPFPGHTELLAARCGSSDFAMMLYIPAGQDVGAEAGLGVVHTTLHQSVRSALDDLTTGRILSRIKLAHQFASGWLRSSGRSRPARIAVAALNPHAGENGLFGDEESAIIRPAVDRARALGIECSGPHSCDTLMGRAAQGEFDMVVAMLHDQGHIALKLLGMHKSVNVTLGLPVIRTSVAHGTAFEIAGRGIADCASLLKAIDVAKQLVRQRP
jgi:4-hydroxythreonine-4-phosphate dehydrogenase